MNMTDAETKAFDAGLEKAKEFCLEHEKESIREKDSFNKDGPDSWMQSRSMIPSQANAEICAAQAIYARIVAFQIEQKKIDAGKVKD